MQNIKYSIIIPTFQHLEDCLKPAIASILKYTDLSQIEIIVVANGCTDGTEEYLKAQDPNIFKYYVYPEPLGYTKATNIGITKATGDYVILFNNDALLLDQPINLWIDMMYKPFQEQEMVGITGPLKLHDVYVNSPVVIFFCAMIPRILFFKLGLLDEIFSPGGCEDIDFTMKVLKAGYKCLQVPSDEKILFTGTNTSVYPIWHQNNKTFSEIPEYGKTIIKRNGLVVMKRHNKSIKLNVGCGYLGLQHHGFVGIDDKIQTADLVGDIMDIDFDLNSIEEIYCGHFINHLPLEKAKLVINRFYDILKPGGFIALEQPNMEEISKEYSNGNRKMELLNNLFEPMQLGDKVYTAQSAWDANTLGEQLVLAGFSNIMVGPEVIIRTGLNFRIQANKP
jgi:glycosyltransferase involved in cell wall biosynthesis